MKPPNEIEHKLWDLLIKPLMYFRPKNVDPWDYLRFLFSVKSRPVSIYRLKRQIPRIPGVRILDNLVADDQIEHRTLKGVGQKLVARGDDFTHTVEVETNLAVFRMSFDEWAKDVRPHLRLSEGQEEI